MTDEGTAGPAGALRPMERVEDLATVCARLQAPFASADRVLEAAGLSRAALERARERWSVAILSDPTLAGRFQNAYAAERVRLAGRGEGALALGAVAVSPSPADAQGGARMTEVLTRAPKGPALPFRAGSYAPPPIPVETRPDADAFNPDATLPVSGVANPLEGPALPFDKKR